MTAPFRPAPPGILPNFANPPFMGLSVLVTAGTFLPLVVAFVAIHLYAKVAILKKWRLDDCPFGIAMIAFETYIVLNRSNGTHALAVQQDTMAKSSLVNLLVFSIALGPVLWLLKVTLFCLLISTFGFIRWLKTCAYVGIISTGLFFATYTIVVVIACGPTPGTDTASYLHGLNREQCSSSTSLNAILSVLLGVVNLITNLYLLLLPRLSVHALDLPPKQKLGAIFILGSGVTMCVCSLVGLVYRIKSLETTDITSSRIPLYVVFLIEIAVGLIIPCMPSVPTVYRQFTAPHINDTTTITTTRIPTFTTLSTLPTERSSPQLPSRTTWRKTHLNIEELPYRKTSAEWSRIARNDLRMKALPPTPLPLNGSLPPSPTTPRSFHSMRLPIMFHTPLHQFR